MSISFSMTMKRIDQEKIPEEEIKEKTKTEMITYLGYISNEEKQNFYLGMAGRKILL